ncbi:sugar phosphate isomerase/epimerase [Paenibacillus sp. WQ 127069]|uniref:Sugar phosphate isomerase/epimerase n=1 Tax=Paenibacillus baimaensis TaxID=2982185 RepID=A0ABT2U940_9BACL|nr:sugar phosphate isomerase/epimerase [Paenibacillus sp. WQ 127069]MCU6791159.1 sugar phosphate isomerase/epimerase [Paenibacillus sp. WQ 127069]
MIGLSCHSRNYGPGTPDEIFSFIKRLGYEYIDVDSVGTIRQGDVIENPKKQAQLVQELTAKYDLKLAEYFLGTVAVDGISVNNSQPDTVLRGKMLDNFARICAYAQMAGFRSIMGSAGALHKEVGYERSFDNAANTLRQMVAIAAEHSISFHVEPSRASLLNVPSQAMLMAQTVEGLKYTLDFLHFQVNGYDQKETMELLNYTGHMHARQAAVGWPKCPFEHGEIDFDAIIKRLRGLRWQGIIAMEFWNGPEEEAAGMNPVEQTLLMRYHLKGLIKKYEC